MPRNYLKDIQKDNSWHKSYQVSKHRESSKIYVYNTFIAPNGPKPKEKGFFFATFWTVLPCSGVTQKTIRRELLCAEQYRYMYADEWDDASWSNYSGTWVLNSI